MAAGLFILGDKSKYRSYGMPAGLVVIQGIGNLLYCLDTYRMNKCKLINIYLSNHGFHDFDDENNYDPRNKTLLEKIL